MPSIGIAGEVDAKLGSTLEGTGVEAEVDRIKLFVSEIENLGPLRNRREQFKQVRHRTIVKVRRRSPDPIVRPCLVGQRRAKFVLPVSVPFFLLLGWKVELRVGLLNHFSRNERQAIAGGQNSLPQRSAIGPSVINVPGFLRFSSVLLEVNLGFLEKLFSPAVFVVLPILCLTTLFGIHRRLVAVQTQLVVELFPFGCRPAINLSQYFLAPLQL